MNFQLRYKTPPCQLQLCSFLIVLLCFLFCFWGATRLSTVASSHLLPEAPSSQLRRQTESVLTWGSFVKADEHQIENGKLTFRELIKWHRATPEPITHTHTNTQMFTSCYHTRKYTTGTISLFCKSDEEIRININVEECVYKLKKKKATLRAPRADADQRFHETSKDNRVPLLGTIQHRAPSHTRLCLHSTDCGVKM